MVNEPILILGSKGNMGKRYKACLDYMSIKSIGVDREDQIPRNLRRAIICTPSNMHTVSADQLIELGYKDLLIEKPLFNKECDFEWGLKNEHLARMQMVNNYRYLDGYSGETIYDYYHAGNEEPWENLFQLIGMAKETFYYSNKSPIWICVLNGRKLTLEDVQRSYVEMLAHWVKGHEIRSISDAYEWYKKAKLWQLKWQSDSKQESAQNDSQIRSFMS